MHKPECFFMGTARNRQPPAADWLLAHENQKSRFLLSMAIDEENGFDVMKCLESSNSGVSQDGFNPGRSGFKTDNLVFCLNGHSCWLILRPLFRELQQSFPGH